MTEIAITYSYSGYGVYWKKSSRPYAIWVDGRKILTAGGNIKTFKTFASAKKATMRITGSTGDFVQQKTAFVRMASIDKWWLLGGDKPNTCVAELSFDDFAIKAINFIKFNEDCFIKIKKANAETKICRVKDILTLKMFDYINISYILKLMSIDAGNVKMLSLLELISVLRTEIKRHNTFNVANKIIVIE